MRPDLVRFSKLLSFVLRHQPQAIGLTLDAQGWAQVDELVAGAQAHGYPLTHELLDKVVADNDKQRFAYSPDGEQIRANQGHSLPVDLALAPLTPPEVLYHGTATRFIASICASGLDAGKRQHVHLSAERATAVKVGQRHGVPIVLTVRAGELHRAGQVFYRSANGVWLTQAVPTAFLEVPPE
jgi:putative RNA 2'-phosphotransferase